MAHTPSPDENDNHHHDPRNGQHVIVADVDEEEQVWTAERLSSASYKDLGSPAAVEDRFFRHLLTPCCLPQVRTLLQARMSTTSRDYSIPMDAFALIQNDSILGFLLLRYPATLLPLLENAAVRAQEHVARQLQQEEEQDNNHNPTSVSTTTRNSYTVKGKGETATRVHARLIHLPPSCCRPSLASMQAADVGKILQVSGTVVRTGPVQMYESARTYQCSGSGGGSNKQNQNNNKKKGCGKTFLVHADLEDRQNALARPERCPLLLDDGTKCPGTSFTVTEGGSVHTDYQELKIQEAVSTLRVGHMPRSLLIKLQHDLVDTCQPGDQVVVVGSLLAQYLAPCQPQVECQVTMAMSAHSIRVVADKGSSAWKQQQQEQQGNDRSGVGEMDKFRKEFDAFWQRPCHVACPLAGRDFICKAVCPKLYGLQTIKLALLMTLIGGVSSDAYQGGNANHHQHNPQAQQQQQQEQNTSGPQPFSMTTQEQAQTSTNYYGGEDYQSAASTAARKDQNAQVKTRRRDQSHLLLVGDPGTGKSQFLRFAAALCPRSVLTTGVGTTSAGLTCAAVREGNGKEFSLEAGALVLADKGVCCIDEFGCIRPQDRTTIHEAMEQQTLSVAKAGIVCKLNCRATIVAVMNPRDCLYDNHTSLSMNTGLGTPLLSRFDLIFKLIDTSDAERDSNVTTYLLNRAIQGAAFGGMQQQQLKQQNADRNPSLPPLEEVWTMDKLRAYIAVVKERYQPVMSNDAATLLERHYEKCRSSQSNTIPVTVRFLESLIRLSQAHARLLYREHVTLEDAVAVIEVMECTAFCYGGFDGMVDDMDSFMYRDPMTIDFGDEPDLDFLCFEHRILQRYGMLNCMDETRRQQAVEALGMTGAGVGHAPSSWQEMEQQPAGGAASSWGAPAANSSSGPPYQDWPVSSVTEDHYGRIHFTQPSQQPKRPRRSK